MSVEDKRFDAAVRAFDELLGKDCPFVVITGAEHGLTVGSNLPQEKAETMLKYAVVEFTSDLPDVDIPDAENN
jgi:hypothetical protein